MAAPDQTREPCPDRILDDVGGAFGMGAVGGSAFHFIKGSKNSPKGERLLGGFQAVRMNAPRVGGSFAVWGGIFSTFDCSAVYLRQKEDPWNSIFAGAATGGFLQLRHGARSATRSAIFGGVLLALIEGAGLMINRMLANMAQPPPPPLEQPMGLPAGIPYAGMPSGQGLGNSNVSATPNPSTEDSGQKSWLGGFFSNKQEASTEDSGQKSWLGGVFSNKKDDVSAPAPSFETSSSSFPSSTLSPSLSTGGVSPPSPSTVDNASGRGSWVGGFFGKKKEEKTTTPSTGETLNSFETTSGPPVPTFDYK